MRFPGISRNLHRVMLGAALGAGVGIACRHSRSVEKPESPPVDGGAPADDDHRTEARRPAHPAARPRPSSGDEGPPLAASPAGLLKPGAIDRIQQALDKRGLLKEHRAGGLDDATQAALRQFQDGADLPATGIPDAETVRKLGLDPDDLFKAAPASH